MEPSTASLAGGPGSWRWRRGGYLGDAAERRAMGELCCEGGGRCVRGNGLEIECKRFTKTSVTTGSRGKLMRSPWQGREQGSTIANRL